MASKIEEKQDVCIKVQIMSFLVSFYFIFWDNDK